MDKLDEAKNTLRQTVTAFVDLLGARDALIELDRIVELEMKKEEATPLIQRSIGLIRWLRSQIEDALDELRAHELPESELAKLPPKGRETWKRSRTYDLRRQHLADAVVLNLLIAHDNVLGTLRGLTDLISAIGYGGLSLLSRGYLIRGGIETGVAIDRGGNEMLGSGMAYSYLLESGAAFYPRVCLGPRLLGFISSFENELSLKSVGCSTAEIDVSKRGANFLRQLLRTDPDGMVRVNFVAPLLMKGLGELGAKLRESAEAEMRRHLSTLDPSKDVAKIQKFQWALSSLA